MESCSYPLEVVFTVTGVLWCFGCRTLRAAQISSTDNLSNCTLHTLEVSPMRCLDGDSTDSFTFDVRVRWGVVEAAWGDFSTWSWSLRCLSGDLSVMWNVPDWERDKLMTISWDKGIWYCKKNNWLVGDSLACGAGRLSFETSISGMSVVESIGWIYKTDFLYCHLHLVWKFI